MSEKLYRVVEAYYADNQANLRPIPGVPTRETEDFGEYIHKHPSSAASKAFTGLQRYMKKYHNYKGRTWFPGYDPDQPPLIVFKLKRYGTPDADDDTDTWTRWYSGERIPAHQGKRVIVNKTDGRVRVYRWDNKVKALGIKSIDELQ